MSNKFNLRVMEGKDLILGSKIQYLGTVNGDPNPIWIDSVITRISDHYVWFKGAPNQRLKRTTFDKWPTLFKIISK